MSPGVGFEGAGRRVAWSRTRRHQTAPGIKRRWRGQVMRCDEQQDAAAWRSPRRRGPSAAPTRRHGACATASCCRARSYWAAAVRRPDGSIEVTSGRKARLPGRERLQQVPLARGMLRLGEAMAVLPSVRRAVGMPILPQEDPRLLGASVGERRADHDARRTGRRAPGVQRAGHRGRDAAPRAARAAGLRGLAVPRRRAQERGRLRGRRSSRRTRPRSMPAAAPTSSPRSC